jgi:hypothetical protein
MTIEEDMVEIFLKHAVLQQQKVVFELSFKKPGLLEKLRLGVSGIHYIQKRILRTFIKDSQAA